MTQIAERPYSVNLSMTTENIEVRQRIIDYFNREIHKVQVPTKTIYPEWT
jgi:hypothetical protein